tara:strand:+ start:364 stop:516 length:153 start_codon:yes stop_codon:yes gene_type:complete
MDNNEVYEVVAMDFRDACLTLEEQEPNINVKDLLLIEEHPTPNPLVDTIH